MSISLSTHVRAQSSATVGVGVPPGPLGAPVLSPEDSLRDPQPRLLGRSWAPPRALGRFWVLPA
eukprot:9487283-Pyramimonas_sp.AAC.1